MLNRLCKGGVSSVNSTPRQHKAPMLAGVRALFKTYSVYKPQNNVLTSVFYWFIRSKTRQFSNRYSTVVVYLYRIDVFSVYNIEPVVPENWQDSPALVNYVNDLYHHVYCTNDKGHCHIRSKSHAIKHVYIQPNQPARITYIVLDIDHPDGIHNALYDTELPPPHLIIQNPANAHVHLVYRLSSPVYTWGKAHSKNIRYLARVEYGMVRKLGADASYGGNLMKNPLHPRWRTYTSITAPVEGYTLKELADFVNLDSLPSDQEAGNDQGYGRNCSIFDEIRPYGYNLAGTNYKGLVEALTPLAVDFNQRFDVPLPQNEVKHIVRSIARYCSKTDFSASDKAFSDLQRYRIQQRWGDSSEQKKQAQIWLSEGVKIKIISEQLGVNRRTLTRWGVQAKK